MTASSAAWWHEAYGAGEYVGKFQTEAAASLPVVRIAAGRDPFGRAYSAMQWQRVRLKTDQQLVEWDSL